MRRYEEPAAWLKRHAGSLPPEEPDRRRESPTASATGPPVWVGRTREDREWVLAVESFVRGFLSKLRSEDREVLEAYYSGESRPGIARRLGVSRQAVSKRLTRARHDLVLAIAERGGYTRPGPRGPGRPRRDYAAEEEAARQVFMAWRAARPRSAGRRKE